MNFNLKESLTTRLRDLHKRDKEIGVQIAPATPESVLYNYRCSRNDWSYFFLGSTVQTQANADELYSSLLTAKAEFIKHNKVHRGEAKLVFDGPPKKVCLPIRSPIR